MFRYKLRTLMIVLAVAPPMLAVAWWLNLTVIVAGIATWFALAVVLLTLPEAEST
jgi:hypothetical protein